MYKKYKCTLLLMFFSSANSHALECWFWQSVEKRYPNAYAYVQKELKAAGIDPTKWKIYNVARPVDSCVNKGRMALPLSILENQGAKNQRTSNLVKAIIAHEIGHLEPKSLIPNRSEYRADGGLIKRFKKNPKIPLEMARFLMSVHQKETAWVFSQQPTTLQKQTVMNLWYDPPFLMTRAQSRNDPHGSHLSRANRFIKEAGLPCNQRLLACLLKRQLSELLSSNIMIKVGVPGEEIDTAPIIDALKTLDAIEIPYPLQTYGQ